MPIYEYACQACGHVQDVYHRMHDTPDVFCDECEGTCEKQITLPMKTSTVNGSELRMRWALGHGLDKARMEREEAEKKFPNIATDEAFEDAPDPDIIKSVDELDERSDGGGKTDE